VTASLSNLTEGVFAPIPTLRSLALQGLVENNWPVEEFMPGDGYREQRGWLRLMTRECEGTYQCVSLEDSLFDVIGREGSEEKKKFRASLDLDELVEVSRSRTGTWKIGNLCIFQPGGGGYLRHVEEERRWIRKLSCRCGEWCGWKETV